MEPLEESGLRFTPPGPISFRFAECPTYRALSGRKIREMDFAYWDERRQFLVLLELKDFSKWLPSEDLLQALIEKGRDSLVMLQSVWRELGDRGRSLRNELPEHVRTPQKLQLYFVLKVGPAGMNREALTPLKDKLRNFIKGYADLLGLPSVEVLLLDHALAIEKGLPLTSIEVDNAPLLT